MTSIEDKVNSILNGEVAQKTEWQDPTMITFRKKPPLAFGELPKDIGIPMDKSHRIPIIEEKDGKYLLCGKEYSEAKKTEKGWIMSNPVDVMSWAFSQDFKFRPAVFGHVKARGAANPEDISNVEVYVKNSEDACCGEDVDVKRGSGLKFAFNPDGSIQSISYGKYPDGHYMHHVEYVSIWKGTIYAYTLNSCECLNDWIDNMDEMGTW